MAKKYKQLKVPDTLHTRIKTKAASEGKTIVQFLDNKFKEEYEVHMTMKSKKVPGGRRLEFGF